VLGRAARQRLLAEFSWASVARRYADLYRAVLRLPAGAADPAIHVA
jgi:glycosyltransferase involved in cell wall biosynthesis